LLVAVLIAELLFPDAGSLKDKRRRLAGLVARIRANYPVSVAEWGTGSLATGDRRRGARDHRRAARPVDARPDRRRDRPRRRGGTSLLPRRVLPPEWGETE